MKLSSFTPSMNVAIIGAAGGIGAAFVDALSASGSVNNISAFSRRPPSITVPKTRFSSFDLLDEESIAEAAAQASAVAPLDLVIVATGLLHRDGVKPEKSWSMLKPDSMREILEVNTIGPAIVAKHFLPTLRRENKSVFSVLSARVGSIEDNRLGGWVSYRGSKAAVNMVIRTLAIELGRKNPNAIAVSLHPGTVDTALSQPFQANVPLGQLFSPQKSANKLLSVIDGLDAQDSGGFFAWDGSKISY